MRNGFRFDQLRGDAHSAAALPDRAFQHIAHAKLAADTLHIDRLALVREARIASDYEQRGDAAQCGDDLLDHAVGEILLLRIAADVLKRHYGDRRLVGQRRRRGRPHLLTTRASLPRMRGRVGEGALRSDAVDPNLASDVLQALLADVDAVAVNVAVFDDHITRDHITRVDADAKLDALVRGGSVVAGHHFPL